jgi:hypothetical protein
MSIIDSSELEDYKKLLHDYGYAEDDFEVFPIKHPMKGSGIQPITGEVKIKHRKTGIERIYNAGHMSNWVSDFETDLRNKIYKI